MCQLLDPLSQAAECCSAVGLDAVAPMPLGLYVNFETVRTKHHELWLEKLNMNIIYIFIFKFKKYQNVHCKHRIHGYM